MRRLDLKAVGIHALPHIENLGFLVGFKVEPFMEKHLDFCQPLPGDLLVRRNDDNIVHVPRIEFSTKEADAKLIELIKVNVGEVLGTDIPKRYAGIAFRTRINHFAKKPIKPKKILVLIRIFLPQLLEPLRDDLLQNLAVNAVKILFDIDLDNRGIIAPFHASDSHIMLHIERCPNRAFAIHTRKGTVNEHRSKKILQFFVNGELNDLVPEMRYVEAARLWFCNCPMPIRPRSILTSIF